MECVANRFESDVAPRGVSSGDDFFVDQLLDFSNAVEEDQLEQSCHNDNLQDGKRNLSISPEEYTAPDNAVLASEQEDFGSLAQTELTVPMEGLESLEWLSHFVEDSFSDYPLTGKLPVKETQKRPSPEILPQEQPCFISPFQTKSRTKRARTGVRIWPILSSSFIAGAEPSTSSSTSSSTSTSFTKPFQHPNNPFTVGCDSAAVAIMTKKPKPKPKPKQKLAEGRRCSHCGVSKTPQWRAGPQGSKSLCNACGVRYKSGRLLPEYRPACSPSFSSELHSNNHRKVLEMRRKKEVEENEHQAGDEVFQE